MNTSVQWVTEVAGQQMSRWKFSICQLYLCIPMKISDSFSKDRNIPSQKLSIWAILPQSKTNAIFISFVINELLTHTTTFSAHAQGLSETSRCSAGWHSGSLTLILSEWRNCTANYENSMPLLHGMALKPEHDNQTETRTFTENIPLLSCVNTSQWLSVGGRSRRMKVVLIFFGS